MSGKKLGCDYCIVTVERDGSSSHQDSCLGLEITRLQAEVEWLNIELADALAARRVRLDAERQRDEALAQLAKVEAVVRAAEALQQRMNEVQDSEAYRSVWAVSQLHIGPYKGSIWEGELRTLQQALAAYRERA